MINLKNKKAVITGATGGIGYSILEKLHSEGVTVLGSGTNDEKLSKLKNDFSGMILKKFDISNFFNIIPEKSFLSLLNFSSFVPEPNTVTPSECNFSKIEYPMPPVAPVMTAFLFFKLIINQ